MVYGGWWHGSFRYYVPECMARVEIRKSFFATSSDYADFVSADTSYLFSQYGALSFARFIVLDAARSFIIFFC